MKTNAKGIVAAAIAAALTAGTAAGSALALPAGWVAQTGGVESAVAWTDGAKADVAWTDGAAGVDCCRFVVRPGEADAIFTTAKDAPRWLVRDEPSQFVRVEIDVDGDDLAFVC